jgi:hypothetical protein
VQHLRSLIYTVMLFLTTAFFAVLVIVLMWLPPARLYAIPRTWARMNLWLLKTLCGLDYRIEGAEHLPDVPFISMWKHSSTWETIAQMLLVPRAAWLLKREILWVPLLGWAIARFRPIAIDRKAGGTAVNQVVTQGRERLSEGLGSDHLSRRDARCPRRDPSVRDERRAACEPVRCPARTDRARLRLLLASPRTPETCGDHSGHHRPADRPPRSRATRDHRAYQALGGFDRRRACATAWAGLITVLRSQLFSMPL